MKLNGNQGSNSSGIYSSSNVGNISDYRTAGDEYGMDKRNGSSSSSCNNLNNFNYSNNDNNSNIKKNNSTVDFVIENGEKKSERGRNGFEEKEIFSLKNKKEHKAESFLSVQDADSYVRNNESKDGHDLRSKSREREKGLVSILKSNSNSNIRSIQKVDSNENEIKYENGKDNFLNSKMDLIVESSNSENKNKNGNSNNQQIKNENLNQNLSQNENQKFKKNIFALHDLTVAYEDYFHEKKTTDRSILMGKFASFKLLINLFFLLIILLSTCNLPYFA